MPSIAPNTRTLMDEIAAQRKRVCLLAQSPELLKIWEGMQKQDKKLLRMLDRQCGTPEGKAQYGEVLKQTRDRVWGRGQDLFHVQLHKEIPRRSSSVWKSA